MRYFVTIEGRTMEVNVGPDGVTVDGRAAQADLVSVPGTDGHSLLLDGTSHPMVAKRVASGSWELHLRGRKLAAEVVDERTRTIRQMTGSSGKPSGPRALKAPMPGLVLKVEVQAGDDVQPGRGLVIMEAMKMENELRAESPARVKQVHVSPGQAVEKDQLLIEFESTEARRVDDEDEGVAAT
jgi:biotin carboxyl carrier protein